MLKRKLFSLFAAALLPLVLSGCMMSASADELYALPQLPEEYQALRARLSEVLDSGAEYAAPQAGGNLPPVQMVDLNGDGNDEALAFVRVSSEERPLKIYVFQAVEEDYRQAAVIDGSGTAIHSVRYDDMDGDGVREVLVSWRVSAEVRSLSVYSMRGLEPLLLMSAPYARYELSDLDGDDDLELVLLRSDDTEAGLTLADFYDWDNGNSGLSLRSTARLSASVAALQDIRAGALTEGEKAIFVTSRDVGANDTSRAITDILAYRSPDLVNIALSSDTGVSTQIFRYLNPSLLPEDINGDGATDVARPAALLSDKGADGEEPYWKLYWYSYDAGGGEERQAVTYHNLTDKWYLNIPEGWDNHFTVRQNNTSSAIHATTFYSVRGGKAEDELLTIYTFTGTDREAQAAKSGRAILRRMGDTVYAVSYASGYERWRYAVDASVVAEGFTPIAKRWSMSEN